MFSSASEHPEDTQSPDEFQGRNGIGPSPEARATARDLAFKAIIEHVSLAESYSRSAAEAAWRGDETTLGVHLRQLRLCVIAALQTFKDPAGGGR
jgi:hypothetical protein